MTPLNDGHVHSGWSWDDATAAGDFDRVLGMNRGDVLTFEEEMRSVLRATAHTRRAVEINAALPLEATILRWWHEEGGQAVTLGSDSYDPARWRGASPTRPGWPRPTASPRE